MLRDDSGLFIVVDGIDGAGKTTLVDRLASFFSCAGEPLVRSKEPTDGPWGQKIRSWALNGRPSVDEEIEAFISDRKEHVRLVVQPALSAGKIVILDRYYYSTICYQSVNAKERFAEIREKVIRSAPTPDATIILDTAPEIGLHRIVEKRGDKPNTFERLDDLRVVRGFFRELGSLPNVASFDASPPADIVSDAVIRHLLDGCLKDRYCAKAWGCDGLICAYRMSGTCRWAELVGAKAGRAAS